MKVDMHNISQRCRLANEYKIKSRITMKQLRYRDDSVKNLAYNPTLHTFCIMRKDVYLIYAIIPTLFPCLCFSTIPPSRFVAKCFVHMCTSEENGIANETIVLE